MVARAKKLPIDWAALVARSRQKPQRKPQPFALPIFPPGVAPAKGMAQDDALGGNSNWAINAWSTGGAAINGIFAEGLEFMGYSYLAILTQRPEYRVISETIATEMTRKWIRITSSGDDDKTKEIQIIEDAFKRLEVQAAFRKIAELDGFFGRSHLYIDLGDDPSNRAELELPIGDGWDKISIAKIKNKPIVALRPVEPVWAYPTNYDSNNPLRASWYKPDSWFVMAQPVHASRLLTFVGREVPDILKPAYAFGGLSLTQMAKPYVDNWLRARQSVSDIINAFSVMVLFTDLSAMIQDGGNKVFDRATLFNNLRDNAGLMMINKATEDFKNVAAPLSTLDTLQAQAQEHMASVSQIPTVKLLGIQPAGLNADSEGVMRAFYDRIEAFQEHLFRVNLHRILGLVMLSELGRIDKDIVIQFEPLWSLDAEKAAIVKKTEAETDDILIASGVLNPMESRKRIANDPDAPYASLDIDDLPELPEAGGENIDIRGTERPGALLEKEAA